jgi:hypothetical protein
MTLYPIEAGNFKLDGGAMFGVVPKSIWKKTNPSDSNNMIEMASRCLLIEDGKRLTLIDAGMGTKQTEKFFSYYYRWGDYDLVSSINKHLDAISIMLLESEGLVFFQMDFGTTPNIAPPSNLKFPASIGYSVILKNKDKELLDSKPKD